MDFTAILKNIDDFVWGIPLIVLIMGTGIMLTCRVKVLQVRKLGRALKFMVKNEEEGEGEVTSFGAFCTAMAATIGTGNIVGVATAVAAGGPGALFWMIIAAFFGMATKYSEGLLAVKYRTIDKDGHALGGPFYYIERGMGTNWRWLAKTFAIFGAGAGLLGIGTITQVNGIALAVKGFADPDDQYTVSLFGNEYSISIIVTAVVVAVATALVVIGGIKRISSVTTVIVPFMAVTYFVVCLSIIIYNIKTFPDAIVTIVESAFGLKAITGGALGAMMVAMQKGVARGIFSNEAGLGSAPIAAAAAKTKTSVRQGLITMTGTFIDTIIICTMTGTTLVMTGAMEQPGLEGAECTSYAFGNGLPWSQSTGAFVLMMCLAFFAFTTILGWDYYAERCVEYLTGKKGKAVTTYKWFYIAAVLIGPFLTVEAVWTIADIFNGLMAIPNLIALVALSGVVARETREYFEKEAHMKLN